MYLFLKQSVNPAFLYTKVFLRNKGIVLSRRRLLELLWDTTGEFINDNTLTVYMKRLRDKIETNPQEPEIIITVRGLGYKVG